MYEDFYGLRELPFDLMPHPRFLFFTDGHRAALTTLEDGLLSPGAITVLLGEAGSGKTTLLRACFESERCRHVRSIHLQNPALTRNEFIDVLAWEFELGSIAATSKALLLQELEAALRDSRTRGQATALVIDEAQSLSDEILEEIRLLADIDTDTEKLLAVVLAGQPELDARLNHPALGPLRQRVASRCEIAPLTLRQTAAYILWQIRAAGSDAEMPFTREAVSLIHELSRGIPGTINVMCDSALSTGFALRRKPVDVGMVLEACRDFDLRHSSDGRST